MTQVFYISDDLFVFLLCSFFKYVRIFITCSILLWKELEDKFSLCNQYSTQEPCSCLYFTQASLIVGAEKFYEIDLKTFEIEGISLFYLFC